MIGAWLLAFVAWLSKSFWDPFLSSYAGEKGKRVATAEDIEKLRAQLHVITTTTEPIKLQLTADEWNRQWLRREKLEHYETFLSSLEKLKRSALEHAIRLRLGSVTNIGALKYLDDFVEFDQVSCSLRIFAGPGVRGAMEAVFALMSQAGSALNTDDGDAAQEILIGPFSKYREALVMQIREEFGIGPIM